MVSKPIFSLVPNKDASSQSYLLHQNEGTTHTWKIRFIRDFNHLELELVDLFLDFFFFFDQ